MTERGPALPLGAGVVHRLRPPGSSVQSRRSGETGCHPGELGARSVRFAGALTPRSLPSAEPVSAGLPPGRTLAGAIRTEVAVHRLLPVHAAGSMVVPRDTNPLQRPAP